jgi:hypothetical protein
MFGFVLCVTINSELFLHVFLFVNTQCAKKRKEKQINYFQRRLKKGFAGGKLKKLSFRHDFNFVFAPKLSQFSIRFDYDYLNMILMMSFSSLNIFFTLQLTAKR